MNFAPIRGSDGKGIIDGFHLPSAQASRILAQFPVGGVESIRAVREARNLKSLFLEEEMSDVEIEKILYE